MTSDLRVLVYGSVEHGICDAYRFGMHLGPLLAHGVEMQPLTKIGFSSPRRDGGLVEAAADQDFTLDRSRLDWADVIVFRRFYQTVWSCASCVFSDPDRATVEAHGEKYGHQVVPPDPLVRPIVEALERDPDLFRGRAIVYETDDDLLDVKSWNGLGRRIAPERDVIAALMRRADLVTTTTPVLAARLRRYNDEVRVVRNAIDRRWYARPDHLPVVEGDPRILYYGLAIRYRDYAIARAAVDHARATIPGVRRVWLGATGAPPAGGWNPAIVDAADELLPFVSGVNAFAQALVEAQPNIGVAPLVGDEFDRAKSELHWLEYTMAGAATIATRTMGGGPFDVIRDGVDGILVRNRGDWRAAVLRVAGSRTLREELAGRARERVEAEYDVTVRAAEWADAYRWAAEHAGRGAGRRLFPAGWTVEDIGEHGRRTAEHRARARVAWETAPDRLATLRGGRDACWEAAPGEPLVSVLIPVTEEPPDLVARALASALAQDHRPLEVLVAGPRASSGVAAMVAAHGSLAHWIPVDPPPYAVPQRMTAQDGLGRATAAAAGAAAGAWIAPLSPEGEFVVDHVSALLEVAREHALEFVYGQSHVALAEGAELILGDWPPGPDGVLTLGSELYAASLLSVVPYDPETWRDGETPGWAQWRRLVAAGVRMAGVEAVVHRLTPFDRTGAAEHQSATSA
jgi:hypothetical protein